MSIMAKIYVVTMTDGSLFGQSIHSTIEEAKHALKADINDIGFTESMDEYAQHIDAWEGGIGPKDGLDLECDANTWVYARAFMLNIFDEVPDQLGFDTKKK